MSEKTKNPWTIISQQIEYDNPWITLNHHDVLDPSGKKGIYGTVHFKNIAVGIIPLDKELNTWLVGQYRFPLNLYSWEIPEGGCPMGQSTLESAKRELKEETGISAKSWKQVLTLHTSNSVTDEYAETFVATDLYFGDANPETCEDLAIQKLPFSEVLNLVLKGEITDAFSVASILKVNLLIQTGAL